MVRALKAGVLVVLLAASFVLAPLATSDPSTGETLVRRIAADGSTSYASGQVWDLPPQAPSLVMTRQESGGEGGNSDIPPPDPAAVEAEKLRPTRTMTFYGHVFGAGMAPGGDADGDGQADNGEWGPDGPQPANTIPTKGDANLGLGFNAQCTQTATAVGPACNEDPNSKLAMFLTAGPVQVHKREDFVYSKLHNERGRTKDVVLDKAGEIKAYLWMSLDAFGWQVGNGVDNTNCIVHLPPDVGCPYPYWGWDPAVYPQWVVEASLYMVELGEYGQGASEPPPLFEAWQGDAMTLIATGAFGPQDVRNGIPGEPNVHEFEINLGAPQVEVIPKTHDLVLVYNWYSAVGGQLNTGAWRLWAGEPFPNRFTLPVKNALDVELVIPQFVHDKLLVHSVIASAWGSYDVDVPSATLTILQGNSPVEIATITRVGDYQVAHGAHFKPVNVTWVWDYKADKLRPGDYKVIVEACNIQHSACEATEGGFIIDNDLAPVEVRVGRSGQRTASEGQISDLTSGQPLTQQDAATQVVEPPQDLSPQKEDVKPAPGPSELLVALGVAAAAFLARRRVN